MAEFPVKLKDILENEDQRLASWNADNRSFRIHDQEKFSAEILPRYFRHDKIASFQRQLNLYGFQKTHIGSTAGSYHHPKFIRYDMASILSMRRNVARGGRLPSDESAGTCEVFDLRSRTGSSTSTGSGDWEPSESNPSGGAPPSSSAPPDVPAPPPHHESNFSYAHEALPPAKRSRYDAGPSMLPQDSEPHHLRGPALDPSAAAYTRHDYAGAAYPPYHNPRHTGRGSHLPYHHPLNYYPAHPRNGDAWLEHLEHLVRGPLPPSSYDLYDLRNGGRGREHLGGAQPGREYDSAGGGWPSLDGPSGGSGARSRHLDLYRGQDYGEPALPPHALPPRPGMEAPSQHHLSMHMHYRHPIFDAPPSSLPRRSAWASSSRRGGDTAEGVHENSLAGLVTMLLSMPPDIVEKDEYNEIAGVLADRLGSKRALSTVLALLHQTRGTAGTQAEPMRRAGAQAGAGAGPSPGADRASPSAPPISSRELPTRPPPQQSQQPAHPEWWDLASAHAAAAANQREPRPQPSGAFSSDAGSAKMESAVESAAPRPTLESAPDRQAMACI